MKPESAASHGATFQLADLLRVIRERQLPIRRVAIGVVALTAIVLMLLPTLYTASAVVVLDQRKNTVADASAVLSDLPTDTASLQNQIQILTSRDLAGNVVDKLELLNNPEFNARLGSGPLAFLPGLHTLLNPAKWFQPRPPAGSAADLAAQRAAAIEIFLRRLSVDTLGLSTSIAVRFTAENPHEAARIANAVVDAYIAEQLKIKSDAAKRATVWLTQRVNQLSGQVQAAESAVQQYKADRNLNQAADGTPLVDQQLAAMNTQLVQARTDLATKEATYNRIKALIASGRAADVSQVVASPLIVQLRTQEAEQMRQEADMATRYGSMHPKLIAAQSQRRDLESKLNEEVSRIAGSLENDVAVARAQVASLQSSLHLTEKDATVQSFAAVKLKALEADAASTRNMYESFVTRLRQTQDQEAIQMPDARVISPASVPIAPSSPHRMLVFAASIPAGLLLGLLVALLAERFGFALPAPRAVRMFRMAKSAPRPVRHVPVFARIPEAASVRAADEMADWPSSAFALGIDRLMRTIVLPPRGVRPRVVAVTAPGAEESKTSIALGLARTAARAGWRVVLVDGDLARAPAARTMGYRAVPHGILAAIRGTAPLSRCFLRDPRSNVLMLSNSSPVANSFGVLASQAMADLFAHLRKSADLVIVDTTPLAARNETLALLRHADAVVLVADPRRTSEAEVLATGRMLSAMRAPPVNLVLAG